MIVAISAAAAVIVFLCVGLFVIVDNTQPSRTHDDGRDTVPEPPGRNGVILVNQGDDVGIIDPLRAARRVTLPSAVAGGTIPVWAPGGQRMAYMSPSGEISILDLVSGITTWVGECRGSGPEPCELAWSHDGATIAATNGSVLRLYEAAAGPMQTPFTIDTIDGHIAFLNWSADDQRLIFTTRPLADWLEVSIQSIGRDGTQLTTILGPDPDAALFSYASLDISPDGTTLAWIDGRPQPSDASGRRPDPDSGNTILQLVTMNLEEGTPVQVRELGVCFCNNSPYVRWSPDGTKFAVVLPGSGPEVDGRYLHNISAIEVYTLNTDGSDVDDLGSGGGAPEWQPLP